MSSAIGKTRITLEIYGNSYSAELEGHNYDADELKDVFSKLLVPAGYSPNAIEDASKGGHWEWTSNAGV